MAGNKKTKRKSAGIRNTITTLGKIPIVFRHTPEQEEKLKQFAYIELSRFEVGDGNEMSWWNLSDRTMVGFLMATKYYELDTQQSMAEALAVMEAIWLRFYEHGAEDTPANWRASPGELEILRATFEAIDAMQDETTRRGMVTILREVNVRRQLGQKDRVLPFPEYKHLLTTEEAVAEPA
jgi:hypothetical protein